MSNAAAKGRDLGVTLRRRLATYEARLAVQIAGPSTAATTSRAASRVSCSVHKYMGLAVGPVVGSSPLAASLPRRASPCPV